MAEIFASNFNNGSADWAVSSGAIFYFIGEDNTRCLSCNGSSAFVTSANLGNHQVEGTFRTQFASIPGSYAGETLLTPGGPYATGAGLQFFTIQGTTGIQFVGYIVYDEDDTTNGQFVIRIKRGGSVGGLTGGPTPQVNPWYFATDAAIIHTGAWHGLQVKWSLNFTTQLLSLVVTLDDVGIGGAATTVVGWTNGAPGSAANLAQGSDLTLSCSQLGPLVSDLHFIQEDVHLSDTSQTFTWLGLTNAPALTADSCEGVFCTAHIDSVTLDRTTCCFTINGTCFPALPAITILDPNGDPIANTVLSRSLTQIITCLDDPSPCNIHGLYSFTTTGSNTYIAPFGNVISPLSGLYQIVADKTNDTLYDSISLDIPPVTMTSNHAIPNPFYETALLGDKD